MKDAPKLYVTPKAANDDITAAKTTPQPTLESKAGVVTFFLFTASSLKSSDLVVITLTADHTYVLASRYKNPVNNLRGKAKL